MKYLAYFQPNEKLSSLILRQNNIVVPSQGLHSTLCVFYMESKHENRLIHDLSQINFNSFDIETINFDDFGKDSLVLKLSRSDELLRLHKRIVAVARNYANPEFDAITKQYFGDNYNPHLTISKSSSEFDRIAKELIGQKDKIAKYTLAKKVNGSWEKMRDFCAGDD
jgi:2'-5' RNA ligase